MIPDASGTPPATPARRARTAATARRRTRDPLAPDPAAGDGADGGFDPHVPNIDYGVLDNLVGYAIRRAQIRIYEDFVQSLAQWQITPPRFSALVIISRNPHLKLTELAQILGIARSGAVLLVDALEAMKLVARRPAAGDRRAYSLVLTPAGRRTLEAATQAVQAHDAHVSSALSDAEQATLKALLARLGPPRAG
ncbi:putative transcriptional regulator, MarR family [Cupriavidus taiwanensis]|uniref:Transcriptional regulator, MarR family n=1 Tax=Cupriavidus taiwanensis TaxID=164546 RepID=A0A976AYT7_9BURK|nr:MarR family winged helix-turn-helix transcriptional regulator [Cupriavidus taiwanensis]SOZ60757.1 putative transcriptional regulator, MarR family [Cupriavidus taiwanensis]SOZ60900.1 putative transcriptional regulator, MarR family [Cupriavidus taiwanensis]SOZ64806.1 putative transcriptional regulator, MarR family [Cupriavidus taiwanensis]SOZ99847.1 putative transcriptional regulator, MarR family [Cupriavidus taiwanensis]SPA06810.1 putative transcriptional regulator, MarR family [Cupriavidus 